MMRGRDQGLAFLSVLATLAIGASLVLAMLDRSEARLANTSAHLTATRAILLADSGLLAVETAWQRDAKDAPEVDHYGEAWSSVQQSEITLMDGATLTVDIADLTGRLNVNDLQEATRQQQAVFTRAFRQLGFPPDLVARIAGFLRSEGPVQNLSDLAKIGLRQDQLDHLAGIATAFPGPQAINLNTAPVAVIRALFPQPGLARRLLALRDDTNQIRASDIRRFGGLTPAGVGWTSTHLQATAIVSINGSSLTRQVVLARDPDDPATVTLISQHLKGR